jgi:hypothetical protein
VERSTRRLGEGPESHSSPRNPDEPLGSTLDEVEQTIRRGHRGLRLFAAGALREWQELGAVNLERRASDEQELRFNPWMTGVGIEPVGALMGLRDPAYRASPDAAPRS